MYTRDFQIPYYMVKENGYMKLNYLISELVWTSTINYEKIVETQAGMENKAWVLLNWDIDIKEIPKYQKTYKFSTEIYGFYKFYAMRNFVISDGQRDIITAKSLWTMIDLNTRSISKIPEQIKETGPDLTRKDLKSYQMDLESLDGEEIHEIQIDNDQIDSNGHVSNAVYLEWFENSLQYDEYNDTKFKNIKIIYKKEIQKDEKIAYRKIEKDRSYYFNIINISSGELKASMILEKY